MVSLRRTRAELSRRLQRWAKVTLPDVPSLQFQHLMAHRRFADLRNPKTFSELLQTRKLSRTDPRWPVLADKVQVKAIVAAELGPEWVIPTLWSGTRLPPRAEREWASPFVIKANHGCGWNLFVTDAQEVDWAQIEATTDAWLAQCYKPYLREKLYFDIPPQLLVEPFVGSTDELPVDYKFFCFGGRVEFVMVQSDRKADLRIETLDREWNSIPLRYGYDRPASPPEKPAGFERMRDAAERLAAPFDFVRIDLYEIDGQPLFGEYSFLPGSGFEAFDPPSYNALFGQLWRAARSGQRPKTG